MNNNQRSLVEDGRLEAVVFGGYPLMIEPDSPIKVFRHDDFQVAPDEPPLDAFPDNGLLPDTESGRMDQLWDYILADNSNGYANGNMHNASYSFEESDQMTSCSLPEMDRMTSCSLPEMVQMTSCSLPEMVQMTSCSLPEIVHTSIPNLKYDCSTYYTGENFSLPSQQVAETPNNLNGDTNLLRFPETYNGGFGDQNYSDQNDYWFQQEQYYSGGISSLPGTETSGNYINRSMMNTGDNGNGNFNHNPNILPRKVKNSKWSEEEHRMFLAGVLDYGWGDWRSISRKVLSTRTASQIASHAQKYQLRQNIPEKSRKRKSIHDINKISYKNFTITVLPTKDSSISMNLR